MNFDTVFLAVVLNSTIRLTTPILFVALGSAFCNRVFIFNIGREGMMLAGAFSAIVANFYTKSVALSIFSAMIASMLVAWLAGIFMVKLNGAMLVVGVSINTLMSGLTTFLMQLIFGIKGAFVSSDLVSLPKIDVSCLRGSPFLYTLFDSLTWLDLFAFVLAFVLNFVLFRTVAGFHMRSVGINKDAANSLGINGDRIQILTIIFSGALSGLGGVLLTMGGVTLFAQNITAGRGYIAMASASLGAAHPIGTIVSSAFFGLAQSLANFLQNSSISSELTMAIPYAATIFALMAYNSFRLRSPRRQSEPK